MESSLDPLNGSPATQLASVSILERLRRSGKFSHEQLDLVQQEVERYFNEEDLSLHDLRIGTSIGDYVLESLLGEGGAGHVFRARSQRNGRERVALKLLKHVRSTDRFRREMELVLRLAHPNVVIAYEAGECHDTLFIAMEELTGPDLHAYVADTGPIPWQQSIPYLLDAASGLEHAHQRDLIHRDVKPGNLILDSGRVKVTDLGLAILTENADDSTLDDKKSFHTQTELLGGTPDFMAPEQARSLAAATVQSDVYGLGASWFYLLTGETRVSGKSVTEKVVNLIRGVGLKGLDGSMAPPEICAVFNKMVSFQARDRYRSMTEVKAALQKIKRTPSKTVLRDSIDVLIVEDDQDDLFLTVEMLERGNKAVHVVPTNTLGNAIGAVQENADIDLVLLDLQLPDSMGVETVKRLRKAAPNVPIIVLTGQADVTVGQACIEAGADDFACKNDLTPHLLERIIFVTLSRHSRRQLTDDETN